MYRSLILYIALSMILVMLISPSEAGTRSCREGETRACGPDLGVCEAGISSCIGGKWSECVGAKGPESEFDICGNGLDDNCDGHVDEGCTGYEERCSDGKQNWNEEGTDCGGSCPRECPDIPWAWLLLIGFGLFIFGLALHYKGGSGSMIMGESLGKD